MYVIRIGIHEARLTLHIAAIRQIKYEERPSPVLNTHYSGWLCTCSWGRIHPQDSAGGFSIRLKKAASDASRS